LHTWLVGGARTAIISAAYAQLKKPWGALTDRWVPHDVHDEVVDFVAKWVEKTELTQERFAGWLGIASIAVVTGRCPHFGRDVLGAQSTG
jgi:hypothetical protein